MLEWHYEASLKLKDLVRYQEGQVVSKTLVQNGGCEHDAAPFNFVCCGEDPENG